LLKPSVTFARLNSVFAGSKNSLQTDKERIAEEGNKAMEKAITDQGLSVEEYTAILNAAQNDPDVGDKLVQRLQAK
jgi:Domain of unknown function (DUF4168)